MKICVIGGTGHIGKFLVPMLIREGHRVTIVVSGRTPLPATQEWCSVATVQQAYGATGWAEAIRAVEPEVLVDILQWDSPVLYEAVKDVVQHFVVCGSVWMFGLARVVPTPEEWQGACWELGYAKRFEELRQVQARARADGVAFTALMPPNICGPYKIPLDCQGGRSLEVHQAHRRGDPVILPAPGNNLIGPCDAEDVARGFWCAIQHRSAAAGEIFNVGAAYALSIIEFVNVYAKMYGVKIPIEYVSWQQFAQDIVPDKGAHWHFRCNMCPSIAKISCRLGYAPQYTPEQTMERAVRWMKDTGLL